MIPITTREPPKIATTDGVSPRNKAAKRVAPIGSPRNEMLMKVAGRYFRE